MYDNTCLESHSKLTVDQSWHFAIEKCLWSCFLCFDYDCCGHLWGRLKAAKGPQERHKPDESQIKVSTWICKCPCLSFVFFSNPNTFFWVHIYRESFQCDCWGPPLCSEGHVLTGVEQWCMRLMFELESPQDATTSFPAFSLLFDSNWREKYLFSIFWLYVS